MLGTREWEILLDHAGTFPSLLEAIGVFRAIGAGAGKLDSLATELRVDRGVLEGVLVASRLACMVIDLLDFLQKESNIVNVVWLYDQLQDGGDALAPIKQGAWYILVKTGNDRLCSRRN